MFNFGMSRGICQFLRNFYIFVEFCGTCYWLVTKVTDLFINFASFKVTPGDCMNSLS